MSSIENDKNRAKLLLFFYTTKFFDKKNAIKHILCHFGSQDTFGKEFV